jgi:Thioredoxin-like
MAAAAALVGASAACGTGHLPKPDSRIGAGMPYAIVDIRPSGGELKAQLTRAAQVAAASNLRPYVEITSEWCPPCHWLDHSFSSRPVEQAFGGTYVVRIDVDHWEGRLGGTGLDAHPDSLPAFIALSDRGRPVGTWVDHQDWTSDVPELAARVLADFFHWP